MHELDRESIGQTPRGTASEYDRRRLRGASTYAQKPIGEPVGLSPHGSAERYLLREAPEISMSTICNVIETAQSSPIVSG